MHFRRMVLGRTSSMGWKAVWKSLLSGPLPGLSVSWCWAVSLASHISNQADQGAHSVTASNCTLSGGWQGWMVACVCLAGPVAWSSSSVPQLTLHHSCGLRGIGTWHKHAGSGYCFFLWVIKSFVLRKKESNQMSHPPPTSQDYSPSHLWLLSRWPHTSMLSKSIVSTSEFFSSLHFFHHSLT